MAKKSVPSWSDVKAKLADLGRSSLIGLEQYLYAASKDNQADGVGDGMDEPLSEYGFDGRSR